MATYSMVASKDSAGVFSRVSSGASNSSISAVRARATNAKMDRVVPMAVFTLSHRSIPVYFPMRMVPPKVSPVTKLVTIWVTWVPVDTAATL